MAVPIGSIQACAGKPGEVNSGGNSKKVHPRVCGEALRMVQQACGGTGPSPRVRGSPAHRTRRHARGGVHPRVCGEAGSISTATSRLMGPSPRVRGSLPRVCGRRQDRGSIPACAGKPRRDRHIGRVPRVHPRVCGEAAGNVSVARLNSGPSPRVRGSPSLTTARIGITRSIPACAGKPACRCRTRCRARVHPRVCGEAPKGDDVPWCSAGPSPRVRGSRSYSPYYSASRGSIPACAGKPTSSSAGPRARRVHPRVCGEAPRGRQRLTSYGGPSPRVRGSLLVAGRAYAFVGSIPACAGKPRLRSLPPQ